MHGKRLVCLSAAAVVASMATGVTASASAASLSGAGSTLVQPLEALWAQGWSSATGNSVSYSGVGSGTGISDITNNVGVDFGASDAPLNATQQGACPTCVMIPWALSATAVGFHLKGIAELLMSGKVLAEIYLGQITNWNNSAIKNLNTAKARKLAGALPVNIKLPNKHITVIYRSDSSGDTYAFTNYLSHVSSAWTSKVGPAATAVSFPVGVQAKGNSGMTAVLSNTNGGIAYIAASYLIQQGGLGAVAMENAAGKYEYPSVPNISAAAAAFPTVPANNAISIVDPPRSAKFAYPISTYTYAIVRKDVGKTSLLQQFITYALTTGQQFGAKLDFATIPSSVISAATNTLNSL